MLYWHLDPQEQTSMTFEMNTNIFFQQNAFENVVRKMAAILFGKPLAYYS